VTRLGERVRAALTGVLIGMLAASCAVPTVTPTPSPSGRFVGEIPTAAELAEWPLALAPASEEGLSALVVARLTRRGDCLYLDSGTGRWLAVWPSPGTTWDGSAVTIDGTTIPVGTSADFGGGETHLNAAVLENADWIKPPPEECLVAKAWWIYAVDSPPSHLTCERVDRQACEAAWRVADTELLVLTDGQEVIRAAVRPTEARLGATGCDPELDVTFELFGSPNVVVTVGRIDGVGLGVCTY
jgi:hypothetical protein